MHSSHFTFNFRLTGMKFDSETVHISWHVDTFVGNFCWGLSFTSFASLPTLRWVSSATKGPLLLSFRIPIIPEESWRPVSSFPVDFRHPSLIQFLHNTSQAISLLKRNFGIRVAIVLPIQRVYRQRSNELKFRILTAHFQTPFLP